MPGRVLRGGALFACVAVAAGWSSVSAAPQGPAKPVGVNEPVRVAVARAVNFLKRMHGLNGNYNGGTHGLGSACLVGLALLESGVKPEDPVLRQIASYVRRNALENYKTYDVSLVLMFLDRLGQKSDEPLLQYMAVRLMAGQGSDGTWTYDCSNGKSLDDKELTRLRNVLAREVRLVARPNARKNEAPGNGEPAVPRDDLPVDPKDPKAAPKKDQNKLEAEPLPPLHAEAEKLLKLSNLQNGPTAPSADGDHSNTQFGTVGLWCARKHGVPVGKALTTLEKHYRQCQNDDGGWGYIGRGGSSQSMTCAGLMGLATGFGARQAVLRNGPAAPPGPAGEKADPGQDGAIKRGLTHLGKVLAAAIAAPAAAKGPHRPQGFRHGGGALGDDLYFMWSLERVGVIYGLDTVGDVDWYAEGVKGLIARQQPDGSWNGDVDTSFALLFLNRANFTRDLTRTIQGRVRDPGRHEFRTADPRDLEKLFGKSADPRVKEGEPETPENAAGPEPATASKVVPPAPASAPADARAFNAEADRLASAIVAASPDERATLLAKVRDAKGAVHTEALLRAFPKLEGDALKQTRDALAVRLTRMRGDTLREMLHDEDRELRRAAALACAMKEDRSHVPDLIKAIEDRESLVSRAARAALKTLTGQDFGPETDADKARAAEAWRGWWNKNKGG